MTNKNIEFVHLHNHSEYSSLDGFAQIKDIVKRVESLGQSAFALTDHGNVNGAYKFYKECKKIKPILGIEAYCVENYNKDSQLFHVTLLSKNNEGWENLLKLFKISHENFYYKPRMSFDDIFKLKSGIICLSGCPGGILSKPIRNNDLKTAENNLEKFANEFEDFYIEVMYHNMQWESDLNKKLRELSANKGIPTVVTNDCHYTIKEHALYQNYLVCDQLKKTINEPNPLKLETEEYYIKSRDEMPGTETEKDLTVKIAEQCNVEIERKNWLLPYIEDQNQKFAKLISKKIEEFDLNEEYKERLRQEYNIIIEANLVGYFLTVYDYIKYAKEQGILVGPGRGSVGGSLVAYLLGIHAVDPIKHKLLFSRFYNAGRKGSLPDIDIDFPEKQIGNIHSYIKEKYGEEKIAHIGTYTYLHNKSSVKLICRVEGVDFNESNKYSQIIEDGELTRITRESSPEFKDITDKVKVFNGLAVYSSVHAAGIIISPLDLENKIPIRPNEDGLYTTNWDMKDVEGMGFVKYDFLSLNTLDVISDTLKYANITLEDIPHDDQKAFDLISNTSNIGIFQLSSDGISQVANQIGINSIDDIAAAVALYRPGPIYNGLHTAYIERKHGREEITYDHPLLEPVLKDTYGVFVYQEQVIKTAMVLAEFSETEADSLRKAIGKKDKDLIKKVGKQFVSGCKNNKIENAEEIWDKINEFGKYSFNLCIDGECYISRDNNHGSQYTIAEMYDIKNNTQQGSKKHLRNKYRNQGYGKAKCLIKDKIFLDYIKDIHYQDKRKVYKITIENGKHITTTDNHKFPTTNGIKQLKHIDIENDYLYIDINRDNDVDNIVKLCPSCHKKEHYRKGRKGKYSKGLTPAIGKIKSIEFVGEKDVYDIEMCNEPHNLFVNGICTCNSHSVGYGYITYYTAYLKAHYPTQFMAALLNNNYNKKEKLLVYLRECCNMGINVLPPSITNGAYDFIPKDNDIVFGLKGVNGIGEKTAKEIYSQQYKDFDDFCIKYRPGSSLLTQMAEAGIFDEFGIKRNQIIKNADIISKSIRKSKPKNNRMFDVQTNIMIPNEEELSDIELADLEYERLNTYLIYSPLEGKELETPDELEGTIYIEGYIAKVKEHITKKKKTMAFVTLITKIGEIEVVIFPFQYMEYRDKIRKNVFVAISGEWNEKLLMNKMWRI